MRVLIILIFTIGNIYANNEKAALDSIQTAISKYPVVNKARRKLEHKIIRRIPLSKKNIAIVGSAISIGVNGKVDTNIIKNIEFKVLKVKVKPKFSYDFRNKTGYSTIDMSFGW